MGVMAVGAGDPLCADLLVHPVGLAPFTVAGPAETPSIHLEELRVLGIMGEVALQAGPYGRRPMGVSALEKIGMADCAEILLFCDDEAGLGVLVVAAVAFLFGIRGANGAGHLCHGLRLLAGCFALLSYNLLMIVAAVLLCRREARHTLKNSGGNLVCGDGIAAAQQSCCGCDPEDFPLFP